MQQKNTQTQNINPSNTEENILVVKRDFLFPSGAWSGLNEVKFDQFINLINEKKEFHPRNLMEQDLRYKQIIPYIVFQHEDHYFLMQRHKKASETRLQSKFTLGIGGHIRKEDMDGTSIFSWAEREFHEEVDYHGNLTITPLGILNDDSNDVGKVHVGLVLLAQGDSKQIRIKSELASGKLVTFDECIYVAQKMESWSQEVLSFLENKK